MTKELKMLYFLYDQHFVQYPLYKDKT